MWIQHFVLYEKIIQDSVNPTLKKKKLLFPCTLHEVVPSKILFPENP